MTKLKIWIVCSAVACLWACGGPENATVDQFFRASLSDDSPTVAAMSAVSTPGRIETWKIVEVASRTTEPFALPALLKEFEAAKKDRDATLEEGRTYLEDEGEALEQIVPKVQEDPEYKFTGKLGEIQEHWQGLVEVRKEKERTFQDLRRAVFAETNLAGKSVMNRGLTIEKLDGEVQVSELMLDLKPEGKDAELPFKITLHKYDLSNRGSDRVEAARWVIVNIEGANPEAEAVVDAAAAAGPVTARADTPARTAPSRPAPAPAAAEPAAEAAGAESEQTAQAAMTYRPIELRGLARVQILTPETKIEGNEVVSTVRVRNISKDWISRFTATEYWYDDQGTGTRGGSRTHDERFMPDDVIELQLRTTKNPDFYQNQFQFSHENGEVDATVVTGFPKSSED